LKDDDSNDERSPLSSQEIEDEPEGETDEQELGVYKKLGIFLASDLI
jgi:hypothetical protein